MAGPGDEPCALIGMPVAVDAMPVAVPLPAESGRHISIVGSGDGPGDATYSAGAVLLQTAAISLGHQHPAGTARFVVLDLLSSRSPDQEVVTELVSTLAVLGHRAERCKADRLVETLADLGGEISERRQGEDDPPTYLVAFGMDRAPNLRNPDPTTFTQPIDALHALWCEGSTVGMHVLGWWGNVRSYRDHLGMEAEGAVDALVLLRISGQDAVDLLGPFVHWAGAPNRALVRDIAEASEPRVVIPFAAVSSDDVDRISTLRDPR